MHRYINRGGGAGSQTHNAGSIRPRSPHFPPSLDPSIAPWALTRERHVSGRRAKQQDGHRGAEKRLHHWALHRSQWPALTSEPGSRAVSRPDRRCSDRRSARVRPARQRRMGMGGGAPVFDVEKSKFCLLGYIAPPHTHPHYRTPYPLTPIKAGKHNKCSMTKRPRGCMHSRIDLYCANVKI